MRFVALFQFWFVLGGCVHLNRPWALVAAVLVIVVAINGYLAYKYYERVSEAQNPSVVQSVVSQDMTPTETARPETTASKAQAEPITTDLMQRASANNIVANSTYIDNPLTNGKPDALLLLLQARGPDNAANYPHQIGVWYDRNRGGRWAIFNQNLEPMEEGSTFKVAVLEGTTGFVHRAKPTNIEGNRTYLNNSLTNGDPNAVLSVTRNWNPGGREGVYNDHPVGVLYDKSVEKWAISNRDDASMPVGAAFNIAVRRHNR